MPRKAAAPRDPAKPRASRRKKVEAASRGLTPAEMASGAEDAVALATAVMSDGGTVLARYRDPLGGKSVLLAALPIDKVQPTPYQRDLSDTHVRRLADAMEKVGRFLDPLIAVRSGESYWTPNGNHRLAALKGLGARSVVALVLPEAEVAYQILALNCEKAHNLKERSLEVIRMARGMAGATPERKESEAAPMFEEAAFLTLGVCYEKRPRYSGGAYNPVVKRIEAFVDQAIPEALAMREARADKLLQLDDLVVEKVAALKAKGFESPYLKSFVVARANPIRFLKGGAPGFDDTIDKMIAAVGKLDLDKVKKEDLSRMGGVPAGDEE